MQDKLRKEIIFLKKNIYYFAVCICIEQGLGRNFVIENVLNLNKKTQNS